MYENQKLKAITSILAISIRISDEDKEVKVIILKENVNGTERETQDINNFIWVTKSKAKYNFYNIISAQMALQIRLLFSFTSRGGGLIGISVLP